MDPLGQGEWAAADDALCIGAQRVAVLVNIILPLWEEIDGGEQRWGRLRKGNLQRAVINRLHANFRRINFSRYCLREIHNRRIVAGESKGVGRSGLTDQSAGVIFGSNRLAVAPVILPQVEGVNQAIIRDVPTLRTSRGNDAILNAGQWFQNIIEYVSVLNHTKSCYVKHGRLIGEQNIQILILIQFPILRGPLNRAGSTCLFGRICLVGRACAGGAAFRYRCILTSRC